MKIIRIKHNGENLTISEWSEKTGISAATIRDRYKHGWKVDDIFKSKPRQKRKYHKASKCWNCARTAANCVWIAFYKPVKGWDAQKIKLKTSTKTVIDTYQVNQCPNFIPIDKR